MSENKKGLLINILLSTVYAVFTLILVMYHEIWADEAQVWLLAKNLSVPQLFKHLVNEGHPSFFYLLIMPFAKAGLSAFVMQIACWLAAAVSVFLLLEYSPFDRFAKFAIVTSAGFLYFFPVIARSYSILPLLVFALAIIYPKANTKTKQHPYLYAVLIVLCANTHVIMFGFCAVLTLYLSNLVSQLSPADRSRHLLTFSISHSKNSLTSLRSLSRIFLGHLFDNLKSRAVPVHSSVTLAQPEISKKPCYSRFIPFTIALFGLLAVVLQLHGTTSSNAVIQLDFSNLFAGTVKVLSQFFINAFDNQYPETGAIMLPNFGFFAIILSGLLYITFFILLFLKDKKLFSLAFLGIMFQLAVYIAGYNHWIFVTRIFCAHLIMIFCFWILLQKSDLTHRFRVFTNSVIAVFFLLTLLNGLKYSFLDLKYSYSGAKETAEFIQKNIDKQNSIIFTDNVPYSVGVVYYLDKKADIHSVFNDKSIKYVVWDESMFHVLSEQGYSEYAEYMKANSEEFRTKKLYALVPFFDFEKMGVKDIKNYKLVFESKPSIVRLEGFRIYEYSNK